MTDERENLVIVGAVRHRDASEVRVTLADYRDRTYIYLERYDIEDGATYRRSGMTFTIPVWRELVTHLVSAINLAEGRASGVVRDEWAEEMAGVKGWKS